MENYPSLGPRSKHGLLHSNEAGPGARLSGLAWDLVAQPSPKPGAARQYTGPPAMVGRCGAETSNLGGVYQLSRLEN